MSVEKAEIPVVDFGKFLKGDEADRKACAGELVAAFKKYGFAYVVNHGVSKELCESLRKETVKFFQLPLEEKMKLAWTSPESNRGYSPIGQEKLDLSRPENDSKESFNIGKEGDALFPNQWPSEAQLPAFKHTFLAYWQAMFQLHLEILRAFALELNLGQDFFDQRCSDQDNTFRILHYPATAKEGCVRAGAHSDYGSITLLMQDDVGGLEVLAPDGETWIPATPVEDAFVVNCGDLLARWANDTVKSTIHRVVSSSEAQAKERYSWVCFCHPNKDTVVECLPQCGEPKYPPIKAFDHLVKQLSSTY